MAVPEVVIPTLLQRLDYFGSWSDIAINYSLIAVCAAPLVRPPPSSSAPPGARGALFLSACGLQVLIWGLVPDCYGVSLVWSTLLGTYLAEIALRAFNPPANLPEPRWLGGSGAGGAVAASVAGIAYYAAVEEPITTVAHLAAVLVGIVLGLALRRCFLLLLLPYYYQA